MLTLVKKNKNEAERTHLSTASPHSNVVSFASKFNARNDKNSQKNVLAAAKKLKW